LLAHHLAESLTGLITHDSIAWRDDKFHVRKHLNEAVDQVSRRKNKALRETVTIALSAANGSGYSRPTIFPRSESGN
jgi:transposase